MEFQTISVDALVANDYNPNEMTDEEFQECKKELAHLGTLPKPIVVRPKDSVYVIVDGEHNWRAAKELGFTTVPCEVLDLDDVEAMRQSYKRNMHGKFNPVKLGKMFERALEQTGLSQRALADQYEISEGTVRNALAYSEAASLRNSYAFEKLPVRQLRLYLTLPPIIRDKWLDAGADTRQLIPEKDLRHWEKETGSKWSDSSFDRLEQEAERYGGGFSYLSQFKDIYDVGLADMVKSTRAEFRQSVDKALKFARWEYWTFHHGDKGLREEIRPYTSLLFDYFADKHLGESLKKEFAKAFRLVRLNGEFVISPAEFTKVFTDSKAFGLSNGYTYQYPQFKYIYQALQVILIGKGLLQAPVDVNTLPDPGEQLLELKLQRDAPDYIKKADLPSKVKALVFDYKDQYVDSATLGQAKKEAVGILVSQYNEKKAEHKRQLAGFGAMGISPAGLSSLSVYFDPSEENVAQIINKRIAVILDKRKVEGMANEDIAHAIVALSHLYRTDTEKQARQEFEGNLLRLKREELLAVYYVMDYMNYVKDMRKIMKGLGER